MLQPEDYRRTSLLPSPGATAIRLWKDETQNLSCKMQWITYPLLVQYPTDYEWTEVDDSSEANDDSESMLLLLFVFHHKSVSYWN